MKRVMAVVLALLFWCNGACALVVEPEEYNTSFANQTGIYAYDAYVLCDSLTLRSKPDIHSKSLRQLSHGQKLLVSMRDGEWYHVYVSQHVEGWVKSEYVLVSPALYITEAETPAYAYDSPYAPRVALLSEGETLPIIHTTEEYYVVSLRGASAWIQRMDATGPDTFSLGKLLTLTAAQLLLTDPDTGTTLYHCEITEPAVLSQMGTLLADAEERTASNCPFGRALLTLAFADGGTALLDLALDDCCIYQIDGKTYSFARSQFSVEEGNPENNVLFSLFPGLMNALGR